MAQPSVFLQLKLSGLLYKVLSENWYIESNSQSILLTDAYMHA